MNKLKLISVMASAGLLAAGCGGSSGGGGGGGGPQPSFVSCVADVCTLSGVVNRDYELDASKEWHMDGLVLVGQGNVTITNEQTANQIKADGVTLRIPAGVEVKAAALSTLLVTRGSRLIAEGTAADPITFSSEDAGYDGFGEWGGIIIQGFAPQYGSGNTGICTTGGASYCNVPGEGGSFVGNYGGNDPADDSGSLRYLRIAEGGVAVGPGNEINGLTLQGVGHGTSIEYVQVHGNLDDGIEWFGGTVNVKYAVLTNNDDDDIDFDQGYKGNIQHVIIQKNPTKAAPSGSNDPRGIEANSSDPDFVSDTEAVLANFTVIGGLVVNSATASNQPGARLRGDVDVKMYNSAVMDFNAGCFEINNANSNALITQVNLTNVFADCTAGFYKSGSAVGTTNTQSIGLTLDSAYALTNAEAAVTAPTITAVNNGSGFVFDATNYVGAVAPGTTPANAWWNGWIIPGSLPAIP